MPGGKSINVEPVYVVDFDPEEIVAAFEKNRGARVKRLPQLSEVELGRLQNLQPCITGAGSWAGLPASARACTITFTSDRITLLSFRFTVEGQAVEETKRTVEFSKGTPDFIVAEALVEDAKPHPELGGAESAD